MSKITAFELDDGTRVPFMIECPNNCTNGVVGTWGSEPHIESAWIKCETCGGSGEKRNPALNWEWRCSGPLGGGVLYLQDTHECKLNGGEHGSHCRWVPLGLAS